MDFKSLSNQDLLSLAKKRSTEEQRLTVEVINIIREVDGRRLFLDLGYGSLFEYVTRELGYDESSAWRRVDAARLMNQIPEIEHKILKGSLSLSNVVHAQKFFRKEEKIKAEKLTLTEKKEVLTKLENKSAREAQKTLLDLSPEQKFAFRESERAMDSTHTEIKIVIHEDLREKLKKLQLLMSHKKPNMTIAELLEILADMALKKLDPEQKSLSQPKEKAKPKGAVEENGFKKDAASLATSQVESHLKNGGTKDRKQRYVPAHVRREVWMRDQGQCRYVDPVTKRRCGSRFKLEIHHEIPFAKSGNSLPQNLKLHCKLHNTYQAVKDYGLEKMQSYIPGLVT